jgi:hypothetical protein
MFFDRAGGGIGGGGGSGCQTYLRIYWLLFTLPPLSVCEQYQYALVCGRMDSDIHPPACLPASVPYFLPVCIPSCLPVCLHSFLPACLSTCMHACQQASLPIS